MIKAVIFDLDNTLVDFFYMKNQAVDAAIKGMIESGLKGSHDEAKKEIFDIYEKQGYEYQEVLNQFIISVYGSINYKILAAGIVSYRIAKEKSLLTYPNVGKTLIAISKMGLKLGLITDAPSREAWTRLYTVGLHNIFDQVVTSDDTKQFKPSAAPFNLILKYFQISANESIMVGDWPERDLEGAKNVGMKTAFAKYGAASDTNGSEIADITLNEIGEIITYIKSQNSK